MPVHVGPALTNEDSEPRFRGLALCVISSAAVAKIRTARLRLTLADGQRNLKVGSGKSNDTKCDFPLLCTMTSGVIVFSIFLSEMTYPG